MVDLDQLAERIERYLEKFDGGFHPSPDQVEIIYEQLRVIQDALSEGIKNTRLTNLTNELRNIIVSRYFH